MRESKLSCRARWVGKWNRSDPVLTPARAATARTLSFAAPGSGAGQAAAVAAGLDEDGVEGEATEPRPHRSEAR